MNLARKENVSEESLTDYVASRPYRAP